MIPHHFYSECVVFTGSTHPHWHLLHESSIIWHKDSGMRDPFSELALEYLSPVTNIWWINVLTSVLQEVSIDRVHPVTLNIHSDKSCHSNPKNTLLCLLSNVHGTKGICVQMPCKNVGCTATYTRAGFIPSASGQNGSNGHTWVRVKTK